MKLIKFSQIKKKFADDKRIQLEDELNWSKNEVKKIFRKFYKKSKKQANFVSERINKEKEF